jgi:hypothetical protein
LRSRQLCSYSKTFQHFMEPEGSLSCSQEPSSTCPYPKLEQSSPYYLRLGLPNGIFPSGFPTNILYALFFALIRATCPGNLILKDQNLQNTLFSFTRGIAKELINLLSG